MSQKQDFRMTQRTLAWVKFETKGLDALEYLGQVVQMLLNRLREYEDVVYVDAAEQVETSQYPLHQSLKGRGNITKPKGHDSEFIEPIKCHKCSLLP